MPLPADGDAVGLAGAAAAAALGAAAAASLASPLADAFGAALAAGASLAALGLAEAPLVLPILPWDGDALGDEPLLAFRAPGFVDCACEELLWEADLGEGAEAGAPGFAPVPGAGRPAEADVGAADPPATRYSRVMQVQACQMILCATRRHEPTNCSC